MSLRKLKVAEVAAVRVQLLVVQQHRCAICHQPVLAGEAVLDHCHTTGAVRDVLHRSCNALLGKVENNYRRYGVKHLSAWAAGMPAYLQKHSVNRSGLLHPTHKSDEEKRLARNAKARKTRAARKAA
jgi:hypothetical protein